MLYCSCGIRVHIVQELRSQEEERVQQLQQQQQDL